MATGTVTNPASLKLLSGTFNVSSSSTGEKTGSISFDTPFTQIIGLVLSWNEKNVNGYFRGNVEYSNRTVNGFNWSANCTNAYNATWKCNWIAFGY